MVFYKQKLAGGDVGGLRARGLPARFPLKMIHRIIFRALQAPMTLHQGISYPGPIRANQLEKNNKQSAPVTWKSQRELPGKRKTDGQPENEFIHFLVCPAVFRCALCAQHGQLRWPARKRWAALSKQLREAARYRSCTTSAIGGSRVALPSWWGLGQSPNVSLPRQISVYRYLSMNYESLIFR